MEFWGIEVKPGHTVKCKPGDDKYLHLSQASLGETKKDKGSTSIPLFVNVDGKKLVIGTLSPEKCPQISYDLVFDKDFELSHAWKDGSVFFVGYKTIIADDEFGDSSDTFSEDEEPLPLQKENGKSVVKDDEPKASSKPSVSTQNAFASKVKPADKPLKAEESNEDDESDEDDSEDEDEDQEMGDSSDEDEGKSSEEEKIALIKPESGKRKPSESSKASVPDKKAKLITPQKTGGQDGKKGVHIATPHPAKQAAKTPATVDKSKPQTPKSGGSFSCKSCSKVFNSDNALQSHSKAKHAGK